MVAFLDQIKADAGIIFIVGDIFDFWYEYKKVVPKGYVRLLGKLAELTDNGIDIRVFTGNHDMWMSGYFEQELNIPVYHHPKVFEWNQKRFYIGHGDGLGPGDHGYKLLKKYSVILFASGCSDSYILHGESVWLITSAVKAGRRQVQPMSIFWEKIRNG